MGKKTKLDTISQQAELLPSKKKPKNDPTQDSKEPNNENTISIADYGVTEVKSLFKKWLKEEKQKDVKELTKAEKLDLFENKYVKKYNKGKLPAKYYEQSGVATDGGTASSTATDINKSTLNHHVADTAPLSSTFTTSTTVTTGTTATTTSGERTGTATGTGTGDVVETPHSYPPPPTTGPVTILLFYAYCPSPKTRSGQDAAIAHCYSTLSSLGMTGRLRIAREGYNCTLTGPTASVVREFTASLVKFDPATFAHTDFKYVDNLPENQLLKGLKVWPVTEIVTYGFDAQDAPLDKRGVHLSPQDFHEAMMDPNAVVIDVRNFNETLLGKFDPPANANATATTSSSSSNHDGDGSSSSGSKSSDKKNSNNNNNNNNKDLTSVFSSAKVLDPCMRRSTEFPQWVQDHREQLKDKKVLMYCTAGVRCERASSFLKNQGIDDVYQLEGGIHRYLDAFPEDGGFWKGKNYTFDKRFNHGASSAEVISTCVYCEKPWDRYQAQKKCGKCNMEVILCKECQKIKPSIPRYKLICPLCKA